VTTPGGAPAQSHGRRFASVILDVDSTLASIEGIDWLARSRGGDLAGRIAQITDRAMNGELLLDAVYGERLSLVRPTRTELDALGDAYINALAPGARAAVRRLHSAGVGVTIISGGLKHAILPLARELELSVDAVHAVAVYFHDTGEYAGFDETSPLARQGGKLEIARALDLARPALGVGDGITDSEMRPALDAFAVFTAYVRRDAAVSVADVELTSFDDLVSYVIP
jgi:phosphoserine phosphatase